MQRVLVVDKNREPLMPCQPARARELLNKGRAAVFRRYPFTIILKNREGGDVQPVALKIDPGSKTTGLALVAEFQRGKRVIWGAELTHRGQQIRDALLTRRQLRRGRRGRKTRYRPARWRNRRRADGSLAPSIQSRVDNVFTWSNRLYRWSPLCGVSLELVKFDTQKMQNPEVSGVEYQQGELAGYEVREYLLEKWNRTCAYCGAKDVPLEVEHIVPKSRGGSNRVSNLTLACTPCNQKKGNQTAAEFGHPTIQRKARQPLKDAAAVNITRWTLFNGFKSSGIPLETGTGARTKYNRRKQDYPKAHWIDAACVGGSGDGVYIAPGHAPLLIQANGHGRRQVQANDRYGFPGAKPKRGGPIYGFLTGDIVRGYNPGGKYAGVHVGRVAVRKSGSFEVRVASGQKITVHHSRISALHRRDGYSYQKGDPLC